MMGRYIYDTAGIVDRLAGYHGSPPTEREREAEMQREVDRLAKIVFPRGL